MQQQPGIARRSACALRPLSPPPPLLYPPASPLPPAQVKRLTNLLIECFEHPVVVTHPRGHVIPQLPPPDLERVRAFLQAQQQGALL